MAARSRFGLPTIFVYFEAFMHFSHCFITIPQPHRCKTISLSRSRPSRRHSGVHFRYANLRLRNHCRSCFVYRLSSSGLTGVLFRAHRCNITSLGRCRPSKMHLKAHSRFAPVNSFCAPVPSPPTRLNPPLSPCFLYRCKTIKSNHCRPSRTHLAARSRVGLPTIFVCFEVFVY